MLTEMLKMADTFTRAADYCSAVSTIDKPVYASSKNWQVNGCLITCSNNPECLGFNSGFTPKDPVCELLYVMITEMMPYDQSPRITNVTAGHPGNATDLHINNLHPLLDSYFQRCHQLSLFAI
eukprot:1393043-Amorphochlora_amoeboformis.AAC.1